MAHTPIYPNSTLSGDNDLARTKVVPYYCPQPGNPAHNGGSLTQAGQNEPISGPTRQSAGQGSAESLQADARPNAGLIRRVGRTSAKQFHTLPPPSRIIDGATQQALSTEEIEEWAMKLQWIWQPERLLEVRTRCGCSGPLFLAQLDSDLRLHLGVGREGVDLCAVWRGDECVMWNNLVGFCSMWPPIPTQEQADSFNAQMRPLIRRNCFLLGGRIEATPEERKEWIQWLAKHTHHR